MEIEDYLERIGYKSTDPIGYNQLAGLMDEHLRSVPFENLDIRRGKRIVLDRDRLVEKIVRKRRGGFCYELNGVFSYLLENLGYQVALASARLPLSDVLLTPEFDHLVIIVRLDRDYLVDVGFGDTFRSPLVIPDGRTEDVSGRYRLRFVSGDSEIYAVEKFIGRQWRLQYRFSVKPRRFDEFEPMCIFHQTSLESMFKQKSLVTVARSDGRLTLTDRALITTSCEGLSKQSINSPGKFEQLLIKHFGRQFLTS